MVSFKGSLQRFSFRDLGCVNCCHPSDCLRSRAGHTNAETAVRCASVHVNAPRRRANLVCLKRVKSRAGRVRVTVNQALEFPCVVLPVRVRSACHDENRKRERGMFRSTHASPVLPSHLSSFWVASNVLQVITKIPHCDCPEPVNAPIANLPSRSASEPGPNATA